jgi:hypothetical protein
VSNEKVIEVVRMLVSELCAGDDGIVWSSPAGRICCLWNAIL